MEVTFLGAWPIHLQRGLFSPLLYCSLMSLENATARQRERLPWGAAAGGWPRGREKEAPKPPTQNLMGSNRLLPAGLLLHHLAKPIKPPNAAASSCPHCSVRERAGGGNGLLRANLNIFAFLVQHPAPGVGAAESCLSQPHGAALSGTGPPARLSPSQVRPQWLKQLEKAAQAPQVLHWKW